METPQSLLNALAIPEPIAKKSNLNIVFPADITLTGKICSVCAKLATQANPNNQLAVILCQSCIYERFFSICVVSSPSRLRRIFLC
jgi:hypothetical protein